MNAQVQPPLRRRSSRRATLLTIAFAVLSVAFTGTVVVIASRRAGVAPPFMSSVVGEPQTVEGAKVAAQRYFDRASAGDAGGAWDLLTDSGRSMTTRDAEVQFANACPGMRGLAVTVTDGHLESSSKAVVIVKVLWATVQATLLYERAAWRVVPQDDQVASWAKPVDKRIADAKRDGSCRPQ